MGLLRRKASRCCARPPARRITHGTSNSNSSAMPGTTSFVVMRDLLPRLPYAVLAVAVALGAAAAANWASREPSSLHRISGAVLRAKWDHRGAHAQQAQQIAAARTPLVLTDSPAAHWPALASWRDVAYLSTYLPVLSDVIISPGSDAHRYWSQEAPLAHLLPEPPQAMVRRTSAFGEVFGLLRAGTPLYWSRALEMDELRSVPAADLAPSDFLRVDRASAGNSSNVWIGGNGVTTAMHFDASHNFFLQIVGTKTSVTRPPLLLPRHQCTKLARPHCVPRPHSCHRVHLCTPAHPSLRLHACVRAAPAAS
jgi:hypothetical protein